MKKLLSLILCIVLVCFTLVSCKEEEIGAYLPNYKNDDTANTTLEKLNFYIITGDNTSADAKVTVPQNINTYLKEKYKIELNIQYFTEAEYSAAVLAAVDSEDPEVRPDIVLINSASLFDSLQPDLVPLNTGSFNFYGEDYKKLNTIVKRVLLDASAENGVYYTVPNNHTIGNYEYVVFNMDMAQNELFYKTEHAFSNPDKVIGNVNTAEAVERFKSEILAKDSTLNVDDYIKVIEGDSGDFEELKYIDLKTGEKQGTVVNFVNVKSYPTATKEEAHRSAFAIIRELSDDGVYESDDEVAALKAHYNQCMKIIYALNDDAQLKNMLQYGYVGTNYTHKLNSKNEITNTVELITDPGVRYEMNHIYTGNSFNTGFYYCEDIGWNAETSSEWLVQIADAKTPDQKLQIEASKISIGGVEVGSGAELTVNAGDVVTDLPTHGITHPDVVITWATEDADVVVNNTTGTLTFATSPEKTVVEITAELTYGEATLVKTFKININASTEG